jgi:hypothetical protein
MANDEMNLPGERELVNFLSAGRTRATSETAGLWPMGSAGRLLMLAHLAAAR